MTLTKRDQGQCQYLHFSIESLVDFQVNKTFGVTMGKRQRKSSIGSDNAGGVDRAVKRRRPDGQDQQREPRPRGKQQQQQQQENQDQLKRQELLFEATAHRETQVEQEEVQHSRGEHHHHLHHQQQQENAEMEPSQTQQQQQQQQQQTTSASLGHNTPKSDDSREPSHVPEAHRADLDKVHDACSTSAFSVRLSDDKKEQQSPHEIVIKNSPDINKNSVSLNPLFSEPKATKEERPPRKASSDDINIMDVVYTLVELKCSPRDNQKVKEVPVGNQSQLENSSCKATPGLDYPSQRLDVFASGQEKNEMASRRRSLVSSQSPRPTVEVTVADTLASANRVLDGGSSNAELQVEAEKRSVVDCRSSTNCTPSDYSCCPPILPVPAWHVLSPISASKEDVNCPDIARKPDVGLNCQNTPKGEESGSNHGSCGSKDSDSKELDLSKPNSKVRNDVVSTLLEKSVPQKDQVSVPPSSCYRRITVPPKKAYLRQSAMVNSETLRDKGEGVAEDLSSSATSAPVDRPENGPKTDSMSSKGQTAVTSQRQQIWRPFHMVEQNYDRPTELVKSIETKDVRGEAAMQRNLNLKNDAFGNDVISCVEKDRSNSLQFEFGDNRLYSSFAAHQCLDVQTKPTDLSNNSKIWSSLDVSQEQAGTRSNSVPDALLVNNNFARNLALEKPRANSCPEAGMTPAGCALMPRSRTPISSTQTVKASTLVGAVIERMLQLD